MTTTLWKELDDQQSQSVTGGRAGIPGAFDMGYMYTDTYYTRDGSMTDTSSYGYTYDAYPDGTLDYKDVLNMMANNGNYVLKQPVLKDPTKYITDLTTTTTSGPYYFEDGSYYISTYTRYTFGFNYVQQGNSRVVV